MTILKKYFKYITIVAILGELYFSPFNTHLRFSAGVIVLNIIILLAEDISYFKLTLFSGMAVFLVRSTIHFIFSNGNILEIASINLPSIIYYIIYGVLVSGINIKSYRENLLKSIIFISLIDAISNISEAFIRGDTSLDVVRIIIVVGLIRSLITYFVYSLYRRQELFILDREHQKRYIQLNTLISNIQAEMFYLRKSMVDIENVMAKSYKLYDENKDDATLREKALDISREVHEIKKDYHRVLKGFESFLKNFERDNKMLLSEIFNIIRENTKRYLEEEGKQIQTFFKYKIDFDLKNYYNLFTILNNLIINSIDECEDNDLIEVLAKQEGENMVLTVSDTGGGIEEDIKPYIFNPGFTTKFDEKTGKPSTGIGLSHVKNIVEDLDGHITIEPKLSNGTTFKVIIPKNSLIG